MRTLFTTAEVGTTGYVQCATNLVPTVPTEYAALWTHAPPPPPPAPAAALEPASVAGLLLLSFEDNPVSRSVLILLAFDIILLLVAWGLRTNGVSGLVEAYQIARTKLQKSTTDLIVHPTAAAKGNGAASTGVPPKGPSAPLALTGPQAQPQLPTLSVHFEVEGDVATFDDSALLRRVATLVSVEEKAVSATLSSGSEGVVLVDIEIGCPDATTLVMAAKLLKKSKEPLGVALGVKFVSKPQVEVSDPASYQGRDPGKGVGAGVLPKRQGWAVNDAIAPTIQERIPSFGGRGLRTRHHVVGGPHVTVGPTMAGPTTAVGRAPSASSIALPLTGVVAGSGESSVAAGIQERIPIHMGANRQRSSTLRQRSSQALARNESSGLLGGLASLPDPTSVGFVSPASVSNQGIQERLPAMPGMRRNARERAGRAPTAGSLPLAPAAAPSPPPSPPPVRPASAEVVGPAGGRSLAAVTESTAAGAAFNARMQSSAKVLPSSSGKDELPDPLLVWDNRTQREIVIGACREHTFFGCCWSLLFGEGPKLSTIAQAVQLLFTTLLGLLLLTCVQLRYTWLGATWFPHSDDAPVMHKLSSISSVAFAAGFICWPCVVVCRLLFMTANRMEATSTNLQARVIFGSAWSIVLLCAFALAVGAINLSANMDSTTVREDVMISFGLSTLAQWLLVEPPMLALLASCGLLLKWFTAFEELSDDKSEAKGEDKGEGAIPPPRVSSLALPPPEGKSHRN